MEYERINTVQLHGLTLGYRDRVLFTDAGIGFGWGEFTALIGRNGTGKSTCCAPSPGFPDRWRATSPSTDEGRTKCRGAR